ncbi:MAG: AAA-like domain-containing protein [Candidatus Aminicenantes bacterium]|nr:AAA-like domain-containing protein [Candidatus Aminicenantes bacterium]
MATTSSRLDTGIVEIGSQFYVEREPGERLMNMVRNETANIILVRGPFKSGKSSLLVRAEDEAKGLGQPTCYIDFQSFQDSDFENLEILFQRIAEKLSLEINNIENPGNLWNERRGIKNNFTKFIEEVILEGETILILFDEVDRVLNSPCRDDFFSTIRNWDSLMKSKDRWRKLNLVMAHYRGPHLWIQDVNQSPFNVGTQIKLNAFELKDIKSLNQTYKNPLKTDNEIEKLMHVTGGQPFLVRWAFHQIATQKYNCVGELENEAIHKCEELERFLQRFLFHMQKEEKLRKSLLRILKGRRCKDTEHFDYLKSLGLIKGDSPKEANIYCQLYEHFFKMHIL